MEGRRPPRRVHLHSAVVAACLFLLAAALGGWPAASAPAGAPPGVAGDENWSALFDAQGLNDKVSALAVLNGSLYAGGKFTTAGGANVNRVARWDGTGWHSLDTGVGTGEVKAFAVSGNDLYVGGTFGGTFAGTPVNGVAKWNGASWEVLGGGVEAGKSVFGLAVQGTDLIAVGNFTAAGGVPASRVARWNGSSWSAIGSGLNGTVYSVTVDGSDIYVAGSFIENTSPIGVARWNGSTWSSFGGGLDSDAYTLTLRSGTLVVGGLFSNAGGAPAQRIAQYNGAAWSPLGDGLGTAGLGNVQALTFAGSDLFAGGQFASSGSTNMSNVAKWDGASWSALGSGVDGTVSALAVYDGALWAGGQFQNAGGKASRNLARWQLPALPTTPTATATTTATRTPTATPTGTVTATATRTATAQPGVTATRTPTATATATATSTPASGQLPTATATTPAGSPAATATTTVSPLTTASSTTTAIPATPTSTPSPPLGNLRVINPIRVVDTRSGTGFGPGGAEIEAQPLRGGFISRFLLAGQRFGGTRLPADLSGVLVNVTIVAPAASGGYVTVYPGDAPAPPNASTVNPSTAVAANFWTTAVPTSGPFAGTLAVYSTVDLDVVIDVVGHFAAGNAPSLSGLTFVAPVRVLDTRFGSTAGYNPDGYPVTPAPLAPGTTRRFAVAGQTFNAPNGQVRLPSNLAGILAHVTIVQDVPSGGFVTLVPGSLTGRPAASTVNPATAVAFNGWAAAIPTSGDGAGTFGLYSTNALDAIVDVVGYWTDDLSPGAASALTLVPPARAVDTRGADVGGPIGLAGTGAPIAVGPIQAGEVRRFRLAGGAFSGLVLPPDTKGVLANVTLVQPAASGGFAAVYPASAAAPPGVSTVNPVTAIAASFWATGLPTFGPETGNIAVFSTNRADIVVDILGYVR